jgi:plasmid stabilization system protein ParE
MVYKIIISPVAQDNIDDAIDYYIGNASLEVAISFYNELQTCYVSLRLNPLFQMRSKKYRAVPVKKFPFLIFFEVDEGQALVRILAVINTYQDSKKWP